MAHTVRDAISLFYLLCEQEQGSSFHTTLSQLANLALQSTGAQGIWFIAATTQRYQRLIESGQCPPSLDNFAQKWQTDQAFTTSLSNDFVEPFVLTSEVTPIAADLWIHGWCCIRA